MKLYLYTDSAYETVLIYRQCIWNCTYTQTVHMKLYLYTDSAYESITAEPVFEACRKNSSCFHLQLCLFLYVTMQVCTASSRSSHFTFTARKMSNVPTFLHGWSEIWTVVGPRAVVCKPLKVLTEYGNVQGGVWASRHPKRSLRKFSLTGAECLVVRCHSTDALTPSSGVSKCAKQQSRSKLYNPEDGISTATRLHGVTS
jgi:hypothetical protein